jgi:hypothetical protein
MDRRIGGAGFCTQAHLCFRIGECAVRITHLPSLKKPAAEKRQFLYTDSVFPQKHEIGPNFVPRSQTIVSDAFKGEHSEIAFMAESSENVMHLDPFRSFSASLLS